MHAGNRVPREPVNHAESPNSRGTSVSKLITETGPLRAIELARVRGRSMRRQAHRSAHRCRGPPSPHRHQRIHTSFPRPSFEHVLPGTRAGHPALSRVSVVSRRRFALYSTVSLSLTREHRCHRVQGQEIPTLDMSYCDSHRHPLSTIPSSTRPRPASAHDRLRRRFCRVDAPEHVDCRGRTSSGTIHG